MKLKTNEHLNRNTNRQKHYKLKTKLVINKEKNGEEQHELINSSI